jgi:hypothetical protein
MKCGVLEVGSVSWPASKYRGEFEEKFKQVITGLGNQEKLHILFVDEAHTIKGAGCQQSKHPGHGQHAETGYNQGQSQGGGVNHLGRILREL